LGLRFIAIAKQVTDLAEVKALVTMSLIPRDLNADYQTFTADADVRLAAEKLPSTVTQADVDDGCCSALYRDKIYESVPFNRQH